MLFARMCMAVAVAALVAPLVVEAGDLTILQTTGTTGAVNRSGKSTQYWSGKTMVVDDVNSRVIVDFGAKTYTVANKTSKDYYSQTFEQLGQQMDAMQAEVKKQMEKLPPEARAMMEKMGHPVEALSGSESAPIELKPTGKKETIAGYATEEYTFSGGVASGSLWLSDKLPLPYGPADAAEVRKLFGRMRAPGMDFARVMSEAKGIPLRTVMSLKVGPGGTTSTTEVVEVKEGPVPAEMLAPPAGFKKTDPPAMKMGK